MCLTLQDHGWSCDHRYEDCRSICCRYQGTDRQMHVLGIWMNTSFVANVFYKRSLLMGVSCLVLGSQISRFKLTFINGFSFTKFSKISLNAFFYYLLLLFVIHYYIIILLLLLLLLSLLLLLLQFFSGSISYVTGHLFKITWGWELEIMWNYHI